MENSRLSYRVKSPLRSVTYDAKMDNEDDLSDSEVINYSDKRKRSLSPEIEDTYSNSSRDSTRSDAGSLWNRLSNVTIPEPPEIILCFWCKRVCDAKNSQSNVGFVRKTSPLSSGDRHFCSEICFSQCRRASFKKSKVCDWCRRVRPTVAYVGFTDGDHQLQFCSDKCLNQYKMQIFCRETEAHLQLHPHLNSLALTNKHGAALITPDLWLKDCSKDIHVGQESNDELLQVVDEQSDNEYRSDESSRTNSPASSVSDESDQPVNLSTNNNHSNEKTNIMRSSPISLRTRPFIKRTNETDSNCRTRHFRRSKHQKSDDTDTTNNASQNNCAPKGTIRVRQLDDELPMEPQGRVDSPSHSPTPQSTTNRFGSTSSVRSSLQEMPPLVPLSSHNNEAPPRPQILPQLLLSYPELFRMQGHQHPFLFQSPHSFPTSSSQPTQPRSTLPSSAPLNVPNLSQYPLGFPPVTILLPLPLPIPIPIPIPMLIPINRDLRNNKSEHDINRKDVSDGSASQDSNKIASSLEKDEEELGIDINGQYSSNDNSASEALNLQKPKLIGVDNSSTEGGGKKERRSIFNYTSDVYEINGTGSFTSPKDHKSWEITASTTPIPNEKERENKAKSDSAKENGTNSRRKKLESSAKKRHSAT